MITLGVLAVVPLGRLIFFIHGTGADIPSNDDIFFLHIIDRVLDGTYAWSNYFRDTFQGSGHSWALPMLVYLGSARFFHWNTYSVIYFGIFLTCLEVFFLQRLLSHEKSPFLRMLSLVAISWFAFGSTQLGGFEHEMVALQLGFCRLGLALGLWGIWEARSRLLALGTMLLGGIVAAYSWGIGPLLCPIFLLAIAIRRRKEGWFYLVWLVGSLLSAAPYLLYLPRSGVDPSRNFLNWQLFLPILGLPVTQSMSVEQATLRGGIALVLGFVALMICWRRGHLLKTWPAFLLMLFVLLASWEISIFRNTLWPHYARVSSLYWIGLAALLCLLWQGDLKENWEKASRLWCYSRYGAAFSGILLFWFYLTSNISLVDKSFMLRSRSPVAAACLAHFEEAPTYCNAYIMQWDTMHVRLLESLGRILQKYRLSVFSNSQTRSLQGEFILENVKLNPASHPEQIFWSADLSGNHVSFLDFRHLNLFLRDGAAVDWKVDLPKGIKPSFFRTAVKVLPPTNPQVPGYAKFKVTILSQDNPTPKIHWEYIAIGKSEWKPFEIPLRSYEGKQITLRLESQINKNEGYIGVYEYPRLDLSLEQISLKKKVPKPLRPMNTDLSTFLPSKTDQDAIFSLDIVNWKSENLDLESSPQKDFLKLNFNPGKNKDAPVKYGEKLNLPLSQYSHLLIKAKYSTSIPLPIIRFFYQINQKPEWYSFDLPILLDGRDHEYSYNLRVLDLPPNAILTAFQFNPFFYEPHKGEESVDINEIRWIHAGPSAQ